jgi:extracellular matrix protein 14
MRQLSAAVVSILLLSPTPIAAVPPTADFERAASTNVGSHPTTSWRTYCYNVMAKWWKKPQREPSLEHLLQQHVEDDETSRKLIARYGEELVLRFNISTSEEAAALAEASNVLFLDVWEFNEDWVDIRVGKNTVSGPECPHGILK